MKAISILNLKGGVGKTVTAVNMAYILAADHNQRVLLADCDSQCNATEFYGLAGQQLPGVADYLLGTAEPYYPENISGTPYNVDVLPASDALMDLDLSAIGSRVKGRCLKDLCDVLREDDAYDYMIFDCPPAFNAASAAALLASDEVIIPIKLDAFSLRGLANVSRQIDNMHKINPVLKIAGALITMWRNTPVVLEAEGSLRECGILPVFEQHIRRTDKIDEMTFERKPITVYSPYSAAGYDYRAFVQEYAGHSFTYGKWSSVSDTQHKRTKTCSVCKASGEEYADHVDANGDGKCDDCGATVSLTITWDAGTNGGTIDGKTSIITTGKPNATATAPTSTPVKTGHAFKGWYTSASGGSLYNTVTITAAKTFYAQFTANSYTLTWDLGNGTTEETKQTYGEKLTLPTEPTRKNAEFLGWFTEANGGTQVDANTIYKTDGDSTYYAHWEITEVFSVTVPVTLPLIVDEGGEVHVGAAEIINASTGDVIVSSVSISTKNGWQLVPYTTDMAHAKVDAKQLGFKINDSVTTKTGDAETFSLTSPWTIAENGKLPLSYDAVVSAVSQPVTEQDVLSVVFVLEWKGE